MRIFFLPNGTNQAKDLLKAAQNGDPSAREELISNHLSFIKKIVLKNVTGFEVIDNRDEYSIGLIAFNEAIDSYKPGFRSFRAFAANVIKRRIIDYRRTQTRYQSRTMITDDVAELPVEELRKDPMDRIEIRSEMEYFIKELAGYGIGLKNLIDETPKHKDSRKICVQVAYLITNEPELRSHFTKYRSLPVKMLLKKINLNAKTVERHRKYIIAICIILLSDSEALKEYVRDFGKGGEKDGR